MYHRNINFARHTVEQYKRRRKQKSVLYKIFRFFLICFLIFFAISFALSYKAIFSQETLGRTISNLPIISQIKNLFDSQTDIVKTDQDRLNFLLMGMGGAGHDGALLTDTIMIASVKLSTNQIALVSIPRDLFVKIPENGWQRINHANAYGELNNYPGGGSALAAKTVEETFGISINYYLLIDFNGFEKVIDDIGGIDVYIDRGFTDNQYPTLDYETQTISFEQGIEHMTGKRALEFARSRHGDNWEGSDFARSKRQQKILLAVKDKILSWKTFMNPNRLYSIFNNAKTSTATNIEPSQLPPLVKLMKNLDYEHIEHYIIDDSPGGLLKPLITEDGAQVLAPKTGDLSELQDFVQNIFVVKDIFDRQLKIIITNGTTVEGLATYTGAVLESWGFSIARLTNSPRQDFEKTVIYDLTNGQEQAALKIIKNRMNANATSNVPEFLEPVLYQTDEFGNQQSIAADFLIVTGTDQQEAIQAIADWQAEQARLAAMTDKEKTKEEGEISEQWENAEE